MADKNIKFDKCIMCRKETDEPIEKHVAFRNNYVEGVGQLCPNCYDQVYNKEVKKVYPY